MGVFFSGEELVRIAVQNEETGYAFYRMAQEKAASAEMKRFFGYLADQEEVHKKKFLELAGGIHNSEQPGEPAARGEVDLYIRAMTDGSLFQGADRNIVMASKASDEASAVDFAIGFEKDTLLFFYQLADLVHSMHKPMVQAIINEEKEHIRRLAEVRKELK
jgi:rubrerythrin